MSIKKLLKHQQENLDKIEYNWILQTPHEENEFVFNTTVNPVEPTRKVNLTLKRQMINLKMLSSAIRNADQPISPEMALEHYNYYQNAIITQWQQIREFHETILTEETPEGIEYENSGKYEDMEFEVRRIICKLYKNITDANTNKAVRFPFHKPAADKKIYKQIELQQSDQSLQNVLEKETTTELIEEDASTPVTYGTAAAPILTVKTLQHLADVKKQVFSQSAEIMCSGSGNQSSGAISAEIIETLHDEEFPIIEKIKLETTSSLEAKEKYKTTTTMAMKPIRIASFNEKIRFLAYCTKLINKCNLEEGQKLGQFSTTSQLNDGRDCINKKMQSHHFYTEIKVVRANESISKKSSKYLSTVLDRNGILQIEGRLKKLRLVKKALNPSEFTWHFKPPAAPHFGGLFEDNTKSATFYLKTIFEDTTLAFKKMSTVLYQIGASFNSRSFHHRIVSSSDKIILHNQMTDKIIEKYSTLCNQIQQPGADTYRNGEVSNLGTRHTDIKRQMYVIQYGYHSRKNVGFLGADLTSLFVHFDHTTDIDELDKNQRKITEITQDQTIHLFGIERGNCIIILLIGVIIEAIIWVKRSNNLLTSRWPGRMFNPEQIK